MTQTIVIVDSNARRADELEGYLSGKLGFRISVVGSGVELLRYLGAGRIPQPDLVIYDLGYEKDVLDTVQAIRQLQPSLPVLALVTQPAIELGIDAVSAGASDFLPCPFHPAQLALAVRKALMARDLQDELWRLRAWNDGAFALGDLAAQSQAMQATIYLAQSVSGAEFPLLLEGAPGVGKEMFARAIHGSSKHKGEPFISLNFALMHPLEMEASLFGNSHEGGAIKDARQGTIFIRGVERMPDALRYRMEQAIVSEMGNSGSPHCRFMFAAFDAARRTAGRERKEVQEFFSAIHALPIAIPALRDVKEDIPMLAEILSRRYGVIEGRPISGITAAAGAMLKEYSWAGNIRQLAQAVFHAVMCCETTQLDVDDFRYLKNPVAAPVTFLPEREGVRAMNKAKRGESESVLSCVDDTGNVRRLEDVEMEIIRYALSRYNGHMSDVARHLGIGRSTLYRKLSETGN